MTPQPLTAQLVARDGSGNEYARAAQRLGPGDRAAVGPVTVDASNVVALVVDTMPNPQGPARLDLRPGTTAAEVTQGGTGQTGPLQIREVR